MKRRSVALVDSSQLFREGLQELLRRSEYMVVASVGTLGELERGLASGRGADVVIVGVESAREGGRQVVLHQSRRAGSADGKLVILANPACFGEMPGAVIECADAFLSKDVSAHVFLLSLELVAHGQKILPARLRAGAREMSAGALGVGENDAGAEPVRGALPYFAAHRAKAEPASADVIRLASRKAAAKSELAPVVRHPDSELSDREDQIIRRLVDGCSNKIIARDLQITEATVKAHMKSLLRKIRVSNRTQAAIWAINNNYLVEPAGMVAGRPMLQSPEAVG